MRGKTGQNVPGTLSVTQTPLNQHVQHETSLCTHAHAHTGLSARVCDERGNLAVAAATTVAAQLSSSAAAAVEAAATEVAVETVAAVIE